MDEKNQIQAPDRALPILPLRPGRQALQRHDTTRHGTTLLAALTHVREHQSSPSSSSSSLDMTPGPAWPTS